MIPLIQFFFDSTVQEVPDQLLLRPYTQTTLLLALGFIGLMFIGLSRMWNLNSVSTIFRVFFNSESIEQAQKENIRFTSISFIMLLANYVVSAGLICWLWLTYFHIEDRDRLWLIAFALPILLAAFEILGIRCIGLISGEQKRVYSVIPNSLVVYALGGVLLLVFAFVWILNPTWNLPIFYVLSFQIGVFYLIRVVKNSAIVLKNGVPWYYLILYFCTLEILPLVLVYYYALRNF
jgi:hypothetical protein